MATARDKRNRSLSEGYDAGNLSDFFIGLALGVCPSNVRDCGGAEYVPYVRRRIEPTLDDQAAISDNKADGAFQARLVGRSAFCPSPICGAAPRSTLSLRYAIVATA